MKLFIVSILFFVATGSQAQELFSSTDPASNIAAHSIGFRVDNSIMDEINTSKINYHMIPELMVGMSRKLMIRGNLFFSNRTDEFRLEGGSIYAKYRFFSKDAMQQHFRMALHGRISSNNSDVHQQEINLNGHNTGYEVGLVATQLLQKVALSSGVTFMQANDNGNGNKFIYADKERKAMNYTLSIGKLMLPKNYESYQQTNLNLMVEFLNQVNLGSGRYYIDVAPTVQLIFASRAKLDVGYRRELSSSMVRTAPNGFLVRLEYNIFGAF